MTAMIIRVHYELLETLAKKFEKEQDRVQRLLDAVSHVTGMLERGGWEGEASAAFCRDMHVDVIPAVRRLYTSLGAAGALIQQMIIVYRAAEEEKSGDKGLSKPSSMKRVASRTPPRLWAPQWSGSSRQTRRQT